MKKSPLKLKPTENQTFILAGSGDEGDLVRRLGLSHEEERRGDFRSACSERYEAFRLIVDVLPRGRGGRTRPQPCQHACGAGNNLRLDDRQLSGGRFRTRRGTGGDAARLRPRRFDGCDADGSRYATSRSANGTVSTTYCPTSTTARHCMRCSKRGHRSSATGKADAQALANLRRHRAVADELRAADHPTDDAYLRDISSERPSQAALARELWLRCEPVMMLYPEFAEELKRL